MGEDFIASFARHGTKPYFITEGYRILFFFNIDVNWPITNSFTVCYCLFRLRVVFIIVYTTLGSWAGAASSPLEFRGGNGDLVFIRGPCAAFLTGCAVFGSGHLISAGCAGSCSRQTALDLVFDGLLLYLTEIGLDWVLFLVGCALVRRSVLIWRQGHCL